MKLPVFNIEGKETDRTVEIKDTIFDIEPNDHAIYLDVKQYLANQRQGTHKTKEKWEVAKSTRKVRRQKGTGFARIGSLKSPILKGGGRVFGPKPRDYSFKLNKKVKQLARKSALTYKLQNNEIIVLEDFTFPEPKTKNYITLLNNLNLKGKKSLLVLHQPIKNIMLSVRNIPKANITIASNLNTYEILDNNKLILTESSIPEIEKLLG